LGIAVPPGRGVEEDQVNVRIWGVASIGRAVQLGLGRMDHFAHATCAGHPPRSTFDLSALNDEGTVTLRLDLPKPGSIARRSLPNLFEATIVPLGIFYLALHFAGMVGAIVLGLAWCYGAIARRALRRERIPGILLIGAALMTARTVVALATGSMFLYFLQPTLGTVAVAGAFLLSVPLRRPLAARLADDFCPLPSGFAGHPHVARFFRNISLLWAGVYLSNAGLTMWLLLSQPVERFVWMKPLVSWGLTGTAIAVSVVYFVRSMRRQGFEVRWVSATPLPLALPLPVPVTAPVAGRPARR
jgi:uncharacterized membrane protein